MKRDAPFFRTASVGSGPSVGWLTVPLDIFAGLILSAMVVLNCADVIGRELWNSPVFGATELTRLMIPFVVFAAMPIVTYREEHISVDLIDLFYPAGGINVRQIALNLITMLLMAGVTVQLYFAAVDAREFTEMTEDLSIGLWNVYYFTSAMAAISTFLLFLNLIRYLRGHGPLSPGHTEEQHSHETFGA